MTTPSKTPIADAAVFLVRWSERLAAYTTSKPNFDGGEVVEANRMRSLEEAAQGLRDALERMRDSARPNSTEHPAMFAAWLNAAKELARFDALKEEK